MEDSHGIRIALSPVQLAAVLSDKSVSEGETLSNRLWGTTPREFLLLVRERVTQLLNKKATDALGTVLSWLVC